MSLTFNSLFSTTLSNFVGAEVEEPAANLNLQFLFLVLMFVAMYFLLLRPQRKRQKETANLQKSIAVGDEVELNSGIYGFISAIEDGLFWLEIAEGVEKGVEIRVSKGSVARKISAEQKPEQ